MDLQGQQPAGGPSEIGPLSDEELQALLLLLEEQRLQENSRAPQTLYSPQAKYLLGDDQLVGKRETGKRTTAHHLSKAQLEQPMSFENAMSDNGAVFLNQKRSKRIGDSSANAVSFSISVINTLIMESGSMIYQVR